MSIRQMVYMLALADQKNLSHAAQACFISQSALSQSLAKLEQTLGVLLFERNKTLWQPTAAGKCYLRAAADIVALHRKMLREIKAFARTGELTIRLGVTLERSSSIFPPVYSRFQAEFPDISLQMGEEHFYRLQQMVMHGELDMALTIVPGADQEEELQSLACAQVMTEEIVLIVPPFHAFTRRDFSDPTELLRMEELAGEKLICHSKQKALRRLVDAAFEKSGVTPRGFFEVTNTRAVIEFVSKGMGISFVPRMFALENPGVGVIPMAAPLFWDLGVMYRKDHDLSPEERRLAAIIKEEFQQMLV